LSDVEPSTVETVSELQDPPLCEPAVASKPNNDTFILEIISATDIPLIDKGKSDPYVEAFLSVPIETDDEKKFQRVGTTVRTITRFDCTDVVWNCFRDLRTTPVEGAVLTLEIYHHYKDNHKSDFLLGKVDVALEAIVDERPITIMFVNFKSGLQGKNPDFAITFRRAFINRPLPMYRTFFMIRHGQSKWNRAMSRINITGLLDRDHALSAEGIKQAVELNSRWRQELLQDTNFSMLHADNSTSFVPDMFDFSRMDDDESLDLGDDSSSDDNSDSDCEGTQSSLNTPKHSSDHSPLPGGLPIPGLNKIYNSFVRRGSMSFGGGHDAAVHAAAAAAAVAGDPGSDTNENRVSPKSRGRSGSTATYPPPIYRQPSGMSPDSGSGDAQDNLESRYSPMPGGFPLLSERRNTFIYESDDPTDEDKNNNNDAPIIAQPTFDSFDPAFPPLEPMDNPFESIGNSVATSLNVNCGIASLAVNPIEQLDVAVIHAEKGPSPSFEPESIETNNAASPAKKSALFDLFSEASVVPKPAEEMTQPPLCPVPVSFTLTTTDEDFAEVIDNVGDDSDSDSGASSPFNAAETFESEAGDVDALDLAISTSGKEDESERDKNGQFSPARVVTDHDDLFSDFAPTPAADLVTVQETQPPCPPAFSVSLPMTRPPLPTARSEEFETNNKVEALSLEMSHSVTEVIEEECDDPGENDEADDDLPQRREEYIKLFMRADIVYSSPLTRALQTALAAMCGHSALTKNKLVLYRIIREIKRIGGLDTVGVECGPGIMRRVKAELTAALGPVKAAELTDSIEVDTSSADTPWWTAISSFDNERDQLERIREFVTFTRYCPHTMPVFVGHSLFFKAFYSKRVSKVMARKRPNLSANMKKYKLDNATLLAVTVKYIDLDTGDSDALILDADILFGGGFHGARHVHHHHHHNHHHHPHSNSEKYQAADLRNDHIAASLTVSGDDIDGSLQLEENNHIEKFTSTIQHSLNSGERSIQKNLNSSKDAITKSVSMISSLFNGDTTPNEK